MKKIVYILAAAAFAFVACTGKDNPSTDPAEGTPSEVKLSQETVVAGPEGGSYDITVTSSEPWRVAGFAEWITIDTAEGQSGSALKLTVAPNESTEAKEANFKVFAGDAVKVLQITSNPSFMLDLVSDENVSISSDAGSFMVSVISNATLDCQFSEDWLSLERTSTAFGKILYEVKVARSQEFKAREGKITISSADVDPVEVTVSQAQRDTAFVVEGESIVKGLEAFDQTLTIRTNVEDLSYSLPSWLAESSASTADKDESGLGTRTIQVHADACGGSRATNLAFRSGNKTIGSVYLKQQNPNPIYAQIEDDALAGVLENAGWVLKDPTTGECEILEAGLSGTSLNVNDTGVSSISGLEVFPALETLTIGGNTRSVTKIALGSSKISSINFDNGLYFTNSELVISGENIKTITMDCSSWQLYYDKLATLDVTGCPALEKLSANRTFYGSSPLRTVYMTAAQAESVAVTVSSATQIVIK